MARVLILTASYGSGHNEAARALATALAAHGAAVRVVDHFAELVHPLFARASRALYYTLLRRAPAVWGAAYALGDRIPSDSPLALGMTRIGAARLAAALQAWRPDAVVTVHATPSAAMASLAEAGTRLPPHVTVVTDFVAHSQWIAGHVDRYCVAAGEVARELVARGLPRDRIVVTGVPLRREFAEPVDAEEARRALGLALDRPVVLAMAGSHGGFGRLPDVATALGRLGRPVDAVVVTGHAAVLRDRLVERVRGTPVRILGHVEDIRRWMAAADLLVTKAGGMTLAEALAAEVPLLAYGSLAGQERRNERFASRAGVALVARSRRELSRLLDRALGDPGLLDTLRDRIREVRRPDATRAVVAVVLEAAGIRT